MGDFERDLHRPTRTYITINHILLHCCTNCSICFGLVPWVMMALSLQDTCLVRHHPIFIAWRVPNNATHRSGKTQAPQAPKATPGVLAMTPEGDDSSALFGSKVLFLSKRLAMCYPLIPRSTQIKYISC